MWGSLVKGAVEGIAAPIEAVGNIIDKLFTSDDERLGRKEAMERWKQQPQMAQVELNKIEAQHRSIFVAGWRPAIGWVCAIGLLYNLILRPVANGFGGEFPAIDSSTLHSLIIALLGLGGLRTFEKIKGKTR